MDVDATVRGHVKDDLWQDAPKGSHGDEIRLRGPKGFQEGRVLHLDRLQDRETFPLTDHLYRRSNQDLPPSFWSIRLSHDTDH